MDTFVDFVVQYLQRVIFLCQRWSKKVFFLQLFFQDTICYYVAKFNDVSLTNVIILC